MTLLLPNSVRTALLDHAREGRPREVCGVLAGRRDAEADGSDGGPDRREDRVERVIRTRNVAEASRVAYEIAPEELHRVLTDVEADDRDVVGFYHSHPTGAAAPSPTDRAAATWTGHLYVIVAPDAGRPVRAWRWSGEAFDEEPVERP